MKASLFVGVAIAMVLAASASAGEGIFGSVRPRNSSAGRSTGPRRSLAEALFGSSKRESLTSNMNHGARWDTSPADETSSPGLLTRTRDFLMPWAKSDPEPMSPTGTRRVYAGKTPPEMQPSSPGPFSWLFGAEEPQKIETVNDFLGQPRVGSRP